LPEIGHFYFALTPISGQDTISGQDIPIKKKLGKKQLKELKAKAKKL